MTRVKAVKDACPLFPELAFVEHVQEYGNLAVGRSACEVVRLRDPRASAR